MRTQRASWRVLALGLSFVAQPLPTMRLDDMVAGGILSRHFNAFVGSVSLLHPFQAVSLIVAAAVSTSPNTADVVGSEPSTSQASGGNSPPWRPPNKDNPLGGDAKSDAEDEDIDAYEEAKAQLDAYMRRIEAVKAKSFVLQKNLRESRRRWRSVESYLAMRRSSRCKAWVSEFSTVLHRLLTL
uniref:Uncharacterized protein n=1 Tax=Neospora caninum (strain Liverpool) TaxID=572307 RepID=A0A0F7U9H5_NEOCL|nr:TPA: hypothetical protein BN1204_015196 [Neospora caninum Liverpool]